MTLRADIAAIRTHKQERLVPFLFPNLFAVAVYRLSAWLRAHQLSPIARLTSVIGQALTGAEIDPQANIGPGLFIEHTHGVVIGPGVIAGERLRLFGGTLLGASFNGAKSKRPENGFPILGDDVLVLAKASVLGPVTVGNGAVIAAHALVLDDVPAGAKALGVPARCVNQSPAAPPREAAA